ncbi:hypothetical protein AVEN_88634-1 [Araneus ventricosus]|uniref:Uncharacterized protein n=1 Tax=Araneus ventricosus TaxID=182803 RepID=A0A4Y2XBJ4_ARAVE|nr:hypothetical protein AVEN_88634-1 [Araneus ventricosus]
MPQPPTPDHILDSPLLQVIAIKSMIWMYFCCRLSSDGEREIKFQGLLDSRQVVQSKEAKKERALAASREVRRHERGGTKINESCSSKNCLI